MHSENLSRSTESVLTKEIKCLVSKCLKSLAQTQTRHTKECKETMNAGDQQSKYHLEALTVLKVRNP